METVKKPLSIKIIYWLTNITFWIYVAAATLLSVLAISFMMGVLDSAQLHVGMPISVNILEKGTLDVGDTFIGIQLVEMTGKIHFIDTPVFIGQIYSVFIMGIVLITFYIFWLFRQFIKHIYRGNYFDTDNIASLKKIAYALVGIWVFTVIYSYFQYFYLAINMNFNSIEITSDVHTYPITLLVALFIWVLSHIFHKGCELQEETNYTI